MRPSSNTSSAVIFSPKYAISLALWTVFVDQRPGALRRLRGSLNDLREAGIEPDSLESCLGDTPRDRALGEVYRSYAAALRQLQDRGWCDDACRR